MVLARRGGKYSVTAGQYCSALQEAPNAQSYAVRRERSTPYTQKLKQTLKDTAQHAREDVSKISDPKAQALFETSAEGLLGLAKAFEDFEQRREEAGKLPAPANSGMLNIDHPCQLSAA
jgi:hypothetical protein